jgi:Bacterial PH domain
VKHFKAPWGTSLIVVSALVTVFCLGITVFRWQAPAVWRLGQFSFWLRLIPVALVMGCALFCIRGYTLTPDMLIIQRLFWQTRIPLAGLQSAEFQPQAMRGSIRTFGNGGFYSLTGYYWSRGLGSYRAFVTDTHRTVILRFAARTIVVSPGCPENFVRELSPNLRSA